MNARIVPWLASMGMISAPGLLPSCAGLHLSDGASTAPSIEDALWWLPEDTESLLVARGPFRIGQLLDVEVHEGAAGLKPMLEAASLLPVSGLYGSRLGESLREAHVAAVLLGSRKFRPSTGLGVMLYEGCHVILLMEDSARAAEEVPRMFQETGARTEVVAGRSVLVKEEKLERDTWTFLVAVPRPDIILLATDRSYLATVLERMAGRAQHRALPEELPEWRHVDRGASFWAIRHYATEDVELDPSSPVGGGDLIGLVDTGAVGFTFEYDPDGSNRAVIRYLSANERAVEVSRDYWASAARGTLSRAPAPEVRWIEDGVVEVRADAELANGLVVMLLWALGHVQFF